MGRFLGQILWVKLAIVTCNSKMDILLTPTLTKHARIIWGNVAAAILLLILAFTAVTTPVWRQMVWIDAVSGSTKERVDWVFGLNGSETIKRSALSDWIERQEGNVTFDWRHVNGTWFTILGRPTGFSHGRAPAIYIFPEYYIRTFVENSDDDELRRFVDTMRSGSDDEQHEAVLEASSEACRILNE